MSASEANAQVLGVEKRKDREWQRRQLKAPNLLRRLRSARCLDVLLKAHCVDTAAAIACLRVAVIFVAASRLSHALNGEDAEHLHQRATAAVAGTFARALVNLAGLRGGSFRSHGGEANDRQVFHDRHGVVLHHAGDDDFVASGGVGLRTTGRGIHHDPRTVVVSAERGRDELSQHAEPLSTKNGRPKNATHGARQIERIPTVLHAPTQQARHIRHTPQPTSTQATRNTHSRTHDQPYRELGFRVRMSRLTPVEVMWVWVSIHLGTLMFRGRAMLDCFPTPLAEGSWRRGKSHKRCRVCAPPPDEEAQLRAGSLWKEEELF